MFIGQVEIANQVITAPMAGITDKTLRKICREMGAGLVFTEMVSDKSLVYLNQRAYKILDIQGEERPVAVQIFGSEPDYMAKAAAIVEEQGADIIDINMGCPTPKIVRNGEGAALMLDLGKARAIIRAVKKAVKVPVTIKTRKGWNEKTPSTAVALALIAEDEGVAAITVHGRTREQFYSGKADWDIVGEVKKAVNIPVVGNGDIFTAVDARAMLEQTHCDAVMIARGMLGNPWLIKHTERYLSVNEVLPQPTLEDRITMAIYHLRGACKHKGAYIGVREMRKHLAWYLKGVHGAARLRDSINSLTKVEDVETLLLGVLHEDSSPSIP